MGQLQGKIALITGAGKGLGKGIARRFVDEGAAVIIAEIDEAAGKATEAELRSKGASATFVRADMSVRDDVFDLVHRIIKEHGRLDVLVNNASGLSPNVVLEEKTDEMLSRVLGIGLWGTWWSMRAAFPSMRAQRDGRIINFYSIDTAAGAWLHSDYNINKAGILALTQSAAVEWGRYGIRTNAIAPVGKGTVWDELIKTPGVAQAAAAMNPLGRVGDPYEDIAPAVVFLASDASRYVNGQLLNADGGQHIPRYLSKPANL